MPVIQNVPFLDSKYLIPSEYLLDVNVSLIVLINGLLSNLLMISVNDIIPINIMPKTNKLFRYNEERKSIIINIAIIVLDI